MTSGERRAVARLQAVFSAEVRPEGADDWATVELVDISITGAGVVAVDWWPVGQSMELACVLPLWRGELDLHVIGRIVSLRPTAWRSSVLARQRYRYGLRFEPLPSRLERDLMAAILWHQAQRCDRAG
jgi:c-di-GMP-binding flagellar brake protein YcgR